MNGSMFAGILGFIGIILMSLAGLVIVDYDLRMVIFVVAVVTMVVAIMVEIIEWGFWK